MDEKQENVVNDEGPSHIVPIPDKTKDVEMSGSRNKLLVCAAGTFICYFYYGIIQESITKGKYGEGEKSEKFTQTMALVFVQCIINALAAKIAMTWQKERDTTSSKLFSFCSLSYLGAMLASNHALQHVSYPTQVLGKSAKPIPVMILGIMFARKRYPLAKFLFVLMIVLGVAMFLYKDSGQTKKSHTDSLIGMGEILLLVSLTLDGVTGAVQERMRTDHKTGPYSMMFNINMWSILWLAIGLVISGQGIDFLGFMERHPSILFKMITFGLASAAGQTFIFITVSTYGPLTCSIITTTRKFFTILGSVIIFQNPMNSRQWLGTVLVFAGLGLDSAYGKEKKKK
ncbi:solute carrier family 35 member B1-like [Ostrea edulis]|uniref:solute carrier family 35 member B1-like n=1 Tax=Ostrea edulis TaxID=37623 RepID=UPI0024AE9811|nr:solute carrier family 35 member B1-like [Ostrea edulis]